MAGSWQVEVDFSGAEGKGEDIKSGNETSLKVLPPWMIKEGMNLTKEQRGEIKLESKMDGSSASVEFSDEKKSAIENDDKKNIQVKAKGKLRRNKCFKSCLCLHHIGFFLVPSLFCFSVLFMSRGFFLTPLFLLPFS